MKNRINQFLMICLLLVGCAPALTSTQSSSTVSGAAAVAAVESAPEAASTPAEVLTTQLTYPVVDTSQGNCYDNRTEIICSQTSFFGQDAQYTGNEPLYQDNGDGTVTDLVNNLMWQQDPGEKMTFNEAVAGADTFILHYHNIRSIPKQRQPWLDSSVAI